MKTNMEMNMKNDTGNGHEKKEVGNLDMKMEMKMQMPNENEDVE